MAIQRQEPWYPFRSARKYITVFDAEYPKQFRHLRYPPWILFYHGDLSLLEAKGVAVIGSRVSSEEGRTSCQQIVGILTEKYVIISGLAKGIARLGTSRGIRSKDHRSDWLRHRVRISERKCRSICTTSSTASDHK